MQEVLALLIGFYPMPIRSALKPHFRFVLKALLEAGILDRWRREWFKRGDLRYSDPTQAGGVNPGSDILNFSDLLPAWFVVLCGTVLSTAVFVLEMLRSNWKSISQKNRKKCFQHFSLLPARTNRP